ncbi:hypothetical protein Tco_0873424 [Tanacetum coccineum]|uniref:Uncharacterized protein n=1 Tax=Tanacetum coccineum TaxID=301880 RepID=A0ABQ5BMB1_9ASTR
MRCFQISMTWARARVPPWRGRLCDPVSWRGTCYWHNVGLEECLAECRTAPGLRIFRNLAGQPIRFAAMADVWCFVNASKFLGNKFIVYDSVAGSYPVSRLQTFCSMKVLASMPLMSMDTRLLRSMSLMCMDIRKVKHIAKEADSHTEGLDKIPTAVKKVERSLIES